MGRLKTKISSHQKEVHMSSYIDWNLFLAGYQKSRGGSFFSCGRERLNQCDSQLVLPTGGAAPADPPPAVRRGAQQLEQPDRPDHYPSGRQLLPAHPPEGPDRGGLSDSDESGGRAPGLRRPCGVKRPGGDHGRPGLHQAGAGGSGAAKRPDRPPRRLPAGRPRPLDDGGAHRGGVLREF